MDHCKKRMTQNLLVGSNTPENASVKAILPNVRCFIFTFRDFGNVQNIFIWKLDFFSNFFANMTDDF